MRKSSAEYKIELKDEVKNEYQFNETQFLIEDEVPDSIAEGLINDVTHSRCNFRKQEFFFLSKKKGNPVKEKMPPFDVKIKHQEEKWRIVESSSDRCRESLAKEMLSQ